VRRVNGIHAYRSAEKTGEWLTMTEAAIKLGVTNHKIRRLIKDRVLVAEQVVPGAPYQIRAGDLDDERVTAVLGRKGRPCRVDLQGGHNERLIATHRRARSPGLLSSARRPSSKQRTSAVQRRI
jgi:excisionase family DNA binding protein